MKIYNWLSILIRFEVSNGLFDTGVRQSWTCTSFASSNPDYHERHKDHFSNEHSVTLPVFLKGI